MAAACEDSLARLHLTPADVDLVVPHQANLRIIEAVARKAHVPMDKVFVNIHRYGNMSAATVAIALCEAVEEGRVRPGGLLMLPGFGGGLTYCAHLVRWGTRTTALQSTAVDLPPNTRSALELIADCLRRKTRPSERATAEQPFAGL
jgi:3-oxoacyl-[acyl-carrier-protein] synthase-3